MACELFRTKLIHKYTHLAYLIMLYLELTDPKAAAERMECWTNDVSGPTSRDVIISMQGPKANTNEYVNVKTH